MPSRRPSAAQRWICSLFVLLLAGTAACGQSDSGVEQDLVVRTVRSGDIELTLQIPSGDLGNDLTADDITVTAVELDPSRFEDAEPIAAFRFGPDGAAFDTPIRALITLPDGVTETRLLLTSGDDETEVLNPVSTRFNVDDASTDAAYEIHHFSDVELIFLTRAHEQSRITILDRPRSQYLVGESFDVRVRVNSGFSSWTMIKRKPDWIRRERRDTLRDQPWTGEVNWTTGAPDASTVVDALYAVGSFDDDVDSPRNEPPLTPLDASSPIAGPDTFTAQFATQTFTCVKPGDWTIDVSVKVYNQAALEITETGFDRAARSQYAQEMGRARPSTPDGLYDRLVGSCVAPSTSTPAPTETPITDPSATPVGSATPANTPEASATPEGQSTPPPVSTPPPGAIAAALDDEVPAGKVLVFLLDDVFFDPNGLTTIGAHPPFCSYPHVHGGMIRSLSPQTNGIYLERDEHLGECGFGPPNFFLIDDPR